MNLSDNLHTPATYPQEGDTYTNINEGGWTPKTVWAYDVINTMRLPGSEQLLRHLDIFNHTIQATEIMVALYIMSYSPGTLNHRKFKTA